MCLQQLFMETQFRYSVRAFLLALGLSTCSREFGIAEMLGDVLAVCGSIYIPGYTHGMLYYF